MSCYNLHNYVSFMGEFTVITCSPSKHFLFCKFRPDNWLIVDLFADTYATPKQLNDQCRPRPINIKYK